MLWTLIIFLPMWVCLFWILAHSISGYRMDTYPTIMVLLVFTGFVLFNDSCYSDSRASMDLITASSLIAQLTAPCLIPMVGLYLRRLRTTERPHPLQMMWLLAPAALFTSGVVLHLLAAPGEIQNFLQELYFGNPDIESYRGTVVYAYYISSVVVFRLVIALEMLLLLIFRIIDAINSKSKFRHIVNFWVGGSIRVKGLQTFNLTLVFILFLIKLLLFRSYINNHPWFMSIMAIMMSIVLSMFCHAAMFSQRRNVTLKDLFNGWRFNYNHLNKDEIISQMLDELVFDSGDENLIRLHKGIENLNSAAEPAQDAEAVPAAPVFTSRILNMASGAWEADSLRARFQHLMIDEQLFLLPRLSLGDVAERLHSNKTYVSKLVNDTYNLGFPELINTLRVDYAEQYIMSHRNAKQTQIASECGFLSASAFNNTFRKITGMTPKMWIASHLDDE